MNSLINTMNLKFEEVNQTTKPTMLQLMADFNAFFDYSFDKQEATKALDAFMRMPDYGKAWLIYIEGHLVGYIVLTMSFSFEYLGKDAFIDELYLKPEHRGKGVGKQVLDIVFEEAKLLGICAIHLEVERNNKGGRVLYEQKGFVGGESRLLLTKKMND